MELLIFVKRVASLFFFLFKKKNVLSVTQNKKTLDLERFVEIKKDIVLNTKVLSSALRLSIFLAF